MSFEDLKEKHIKLIKDRKEENDKVTLDKIYGWFEDRNLFEGSDEYKQVLKVFEEVGEASQALIREDEEAQKEEIGDIIFSTLGLAFFKGFDPIECVQIAYDKVKKRDGIIVDGVYIKKEDLNQEQMEKYFPEESKRPKEFIDVNYEVKEN